MRRVSFRRAGNYFFKFSNFSNSDKGTNYLTSSCVHFVPCFFPNVKLGFPIADTDNDNEADVGGGEGSSLMAVAEALIFVEPNDGLGRLLLSFGGF